MNYSEAIEVIKRNAHLIGKTSEKGFVINTLIMVPKGHDDIGKYLHSYMTLKDYTLANEPYKNEDLAVWAIDTKHLYESAY